MLVSSRQRRASLRRATCLLPVACALLAVAVGACHGDHDEDATVVGHIDQASFPHPVGQVIVAASDGTRFVSPVRDGAFSVELPEDRSYSITMHAADGTYPLVVGGGHGRYTVDVAVRGEGFADVGLVRLYDPVAVPHADSDVCVSGFFEASEEPCIEAPEIVTCRKRKDRRSEYGEHGEHDQHGEHGEHDQHGEHDTESGELAAYDVIEGAVAVPTIGLPPTLGCGRRGHGDHDDDDGGRDDDDGHDDDDDHDDHDDDGHDDDD